MVKLASTSLPPKQREVVRSPTRAMPWSNPRAQFNAVTHTSNAVGLKLQERQEAY